MTQKIQIRLKFRLKWLFNSKFLCFFVKVPQYFSPSIDVNKIFEIKDEVFYLKEFNSEETVKITPPCAIVGPAPVSCRLMSSIKRKGQVNNTFFSWNFKLYLYIPFFYLGICNQRE